MLIILKKRIKKKSQITVFIIVGLLILIFVGFLMLIVSHIKTDITFKTKQTTIKGYIENCVEASASDGLYLIGRQGGYIKLPNNYYSTDYGNIAYGFVDERDVLRDINEIKREYEKYIKEQTLVCVNDFNSFKDKGYNVSYTEPKVNVIFASRTIVDVKFNVKYKLGDTSSSVSLFKVILPVRFSRIYGLANKLVEKMTLFPGYIDMTLLGNNDIDAYVLPYIKDKDNNMVNVIVLEDRKSKLKERPYKFIFAVK